MDGRFEGGSYHGTFCLLQENLHVYAMAEMPFMVQLLPALWVTLIWGRNATIKENHQ